MTYSYDWHGFLSDTPIPDRTTTVAPPDPSDWPAGQRPNWTGYAWVYLDWPPATPPAPPSKRIVSLLEFMDLFTDAELAAILTAAKASPAVEVWVRKLEMAGEVDLDSPRTVAGVHALEAAGLIAAGRAAEILS